MKRLALLIWAAALFGCSAPTQEASQPAPAPTTVEAALQTPKLRQYLPALQSFAQSRILNETLEEKQAQRSKLALDRSQQTAKYEEAKARGEKVKPPTRPTIQTEKSVAQAFPKIHYPNLLAEIYDVENQPVMERFVKIDGSLTELGALVVQTIQNADLHALDVDDFAPQKILDAAEHYKKLAEAASQYAGLELNERELQSLDRNLQKHPEILSELAANNEHAGEALFSVLSDFETSPVPRFAAAFTTWKDRQKYVVEYREHLELAIADAFLLWAEQLKLGNLEKFSKEELEKYTTQDNPNDIHPKHYSKIVEERLRVEFSDFLALDDVDAARTHLDNLIPKHEQYSRLQRARERYREIVKEGGWKEVPADNMNAGGRAPLVLSLKKRLAAEGYYNGNMDELFDQSLTQAISAYQTHHQLDVTGTVDQTFWRSLNVSAEQRLAEIEVNIRRWHRTMFEPCDRFIYINIPSFTVELWDSGKIVDVHNVIVGNSTRICNARTREWELMNATHLLHARMTYLVFNPYWNVPPRIEVDEYQKRMAENPKWLEQSDFEFYTPKGGGRVLRQKPGPNNALGKVKLIFPNRYNIYLHDTPKQTMFQYTVRAFSHGCMRVQNAMKFAESVLRLDGQWDKKRIDKFFVEKGEHAVDLIQPIDVFIEYHTVTVDDDGQVYFLADVYKIIKNQIHPPTALERACDPSVDKVSSFRSGGAAGDTGP